MIGEDPLDDQQRMRAACVYAAARAMLDNEPLGETLVQVARYIETGEFIEADKPRKRPSLDLARWMPGTSRE